jgi:integrase
MRDLVILLLLARLGLRAAEVAGLELEDFYRQAGAVAVRGKAERRTLVCNNGAPGAKTGPGARLAPGPFRPYAAAKCSASPKYECPAHF